MSKAKTICTRIGNKSNAAIGKSGYYIIISHRMLIVVRLNRDLHFAARLIQSKTLQLRNSHSPGHQIDSSRAFQGKIAA